MIANWKKIRDGEAFSYREQSARQIGECNWGIHIADGPFMMGASGAAEE
jgi:hypothetical protein